MSEDCWFPIEEKKTTGHWSSRLLCDPRCGNWWPNIFCQDLNRSTLPSTTLGATSESPNCLHNLVSLAYWSQHERFLVCLLFSNGKHWFQPSIVPVISRLVHSCQSPATYILTLSTTILTLSTTILTQQPYSLCQQPYLLCQQPYSVNNHFHIILGC